MRTGMLYERLFQRLKLLIRYSLWVLLMFLILLFVFDSIIILWRKQGDKLIG